MRDGRSAPPPLPREFFWIAATALLNRTLGSSYRVEDLLQMPSDQLDLLLIWCQHVR